MPHWHKDKIANMFSQSPRPLYTYKWPLDRMIIFTNLTKILLFFPSFRVTLPILHIVSTSRSLPITFYFFLPTEVFSQSPSRIAGTWYESKMFHISMHVTFLVSRTKTKQVFLHLKFNNLHNWTYRTNFKGYLK